MQAIAGDFEKMMRNVRVHALNTASPRPPLSFRDFLLRTVSVSTLREVGALLTPTEREMLLRVRA